MFREPELRDVNTTTDALAGQLGDILGTPVVDDTGMHGKYDFSFTVHSGNGQEIGTELARVGLGLEKGKRTVRTLVIDGN